MKRRTTRLRVVAALMAMVLAFGLAGCGSKDKPASDPLESMKEFKTPDGSSSIYLNKDWITQDAGVDYWLLAGNEKDTVAMMLMQCPKSVFSAAITDVDNFKEYVRESYTVKDEVQETDVPTIEGMTDVSAETCEVTTEDGTAYTYLAYAQTDYAWYALIFMSDPKLTEASKSSFRASVGTLKEFAPEEENSTSAESSDTIRWFNATYAVLTELNSNDYTIFGGMAANDLTKSAMEATLKEWWDVTDKATAESTIDWLLTEGHRTDFAETMRVLEEKGMKDMAEADRVDYLLSNSEMTEEEAASCAKAYGYYEEYGATAIDGWDYCRAMSLLGWFYIAGYYTETEALDKSLEVAQTIQTTFTSWDELMDSYLRGYEYWNSSDSSDRRAVYEEIKTRDNSPYNLDWNLTLEKTW